MAISFNEVPASGRVPFVYIEFDSVPTGAAGALRTLLIGQKTSSGSATAEVPVQVSDAAAAQSLFGEGSHLALMAAAYRRQDPLGELWAVPLGDATSSVADTKTITVTAGASVLAGTIALYIGDRRIPVAVTAGDTATEIGAAINTAIGAASGLPVTAAAAAGVVTLTARCKGTVAKELRVQHSLRAGEALPGGVTLAIATGTAGSIDPDVDDVWTAIGDEQFHVIATPYTADDSMDKVDIELASRWGALRQIEGVACAAITGTAAEATTYGNARNSPHVVVMDAGTSPTTTYEWAAALAGVVARYGSIDPARPFQTLPLAGIAGDALADQRARSERNTLLHDGIATHTVGRDGTVRVERLVTTYQTAPGGSPDISYLDLNTPLTLAYLRRDFRSTIRNKYPRHKLADDGTRVGPGQAVMTPSTGRAEAVAALRRWEEAGLVEGVEEAIAALICERNATDRTRLDWLLKPDLINQFRVGGAKIQFLL